MAGQISPKQLEPNRSNARHSTGPRTPEGKACPGLRSGKRVKFNALKPCPGLRSGNGLLTKAVVLLSEASGIRQMGATPKLVWGCPESQPDTLKIVRYENAIERQLHRAIDQLQRLQERRQPTVSPPPEDPPIEKN
ncbi:MAG: hypothetical protein AB1744_14670 [Candidatus Zixiibacteriota bacterium]